VAGIFTFLLILFKPVAHYMQLVLLVYPQSLYSFSNYFQDNWRIENPKTYHVSRNSRFSTCLLGFP